MKNDFYIRLAQQIEDTKAKGYTKMNALLHQANKLILKLIMSKKYLTSVPIII